MIVSGRTILLDEGVEARIGGLTLWVSSHGYVRAYEKRGSEFYLHRWIVDAPSGLVVDHINGDKLDNRLANLRICEQKHNTLNSRVRTDNKSGVPGVYWSEGRQKWQAQININGKMKSLGRFASKGDAIRARLAAQQEMHGEFSRLNGVLKP